MSCVGKVTDYVTKHIYWQMKVSNEEIRERSGMRTIGEQVKARRWKWLGHVLRMSSEQNPKIALAWAPKRKRQGRWPRETWRRTINKEREHLRRGETQRWWQKTELLGGEGLMAPFSTRRERKDDDVT